MLRHWLAAVLLCRPALACAEELSWPEPLVQEIKESIRKEPPPQNRLERYRQMVAAAAARPVAFDELRAAVLSAAGVERISALFETAIKGGVDSGAKLLIPEIGGEATLDAALTFHEVPDPTKPLLRKLSAAAGDPKALEALFVSDSEDMAFLDRSNLRGLLGKIPSYRARGDAEEDILKVLRNTVRLMIENAADSYIFDSDAQELAILAREWPGRYVGRWHLHPPRHTEKGWDNKEGSQPSHTDMALALANGQELTLIFEPDGFTVYDLSPLAAARKADLALARKIEYRSPSWAGRFQKLHAPR